MSEDVQTLCLRDAGSWFEPFASIKEKPCSFVKLMEILRRADPDSIVSRLRQFFRRRCA